MESSSFGKLAPELRNNIYEHVLCLEEPIRVLVGGTTPCIQTPSSSEHVLALTAMCKQMRKEFLASFYCDNKFELVTETFKLSGTVRPDEDFLQDSAFESITRKKYITTSKHALWKWFRQIGYENAKLLTEVDIILGTLDTTHPMHVEPSIALPETLAPLVKFFKTSGTICALVVDVIYTSTSYDRPLSNLQLPLTDLLEAEHRIRLKCRDRNAELVHGRTSGRYDAEQLRVLKKHLLMTRKELWFLVQGVDAKSEKRSYELF